MLRIEGIPISTGFVRGIAVVYDIEVERILEVSHGELSTSEVAFECDRLDEALNQSHQDLQLLEQASSKLPNLCDSASILSAHSLITQEIAGLVKQYVSRELVNAEDALNSVICQWIDSLQQLDNEYMRQREVDIRDAGKRMTRYLTNSFPWNKGSLPQGSIIVARELLPSEVIELANCGVSGIITERGGRFSHTSIVAQSVGIPAVTRILHATSLIRPGMELLLDGQSGSVVLTPSKSDKDTFTERKQNYLNQVTAQVAKSQDRCLTHDGIEVSLRANIGLPEEVSAVEENNLAGIGLFRTEFIFLESQKTPDFEIQAGIYGDVAKALDGLPFVIRTFDLGGDKLPPFLLAENSDLQCHLHLRGLRFSLAEGKLLDEQLHAILQTAQTSEVHIMFPMVVSSDDITQAIAAVDRILEKFDFQISPTIGAMVETPAALYAIEEILDLVDFIAIGTNDLTQYMLAMDRDLVEWQDDCTAMHPAVLRAINQVIVAAEKFKCPVCVCGEEASDPDFAYLLIGLGIRELSISPGRAVALSQVIGKINSLAAAKTAQLAVNCRSQGEVRRLFTELHSDTSKLG